MWHQVVTEEVEGKDAVVGVLGEERLATVVAIQGVVDQAATDGGASGSWHDSR